MGGIGKFIGNVVKGVTNIVTSIIGGINNVVSGFLGMLGFSFDMPEYDNPNNFEAQAQGILVNKQSAISSIPIVYGKRRIGGTRVYVNSGGDKNQFLYVCLALCEGEINSFTKFYINDEEQNLTGFTPTAADGTQYTHEIQKVRADGQNSTYYVDDKSTVKVQFFTGRENQPASSLLKEQANDWNDLHQLNGVAYVALRFEWTLPSTGSTSPYNGGIPTVNVEVEGKKILSSYSSSNNTDTATSSYESQIGSFSYGISSGINPANILLDYLRNPRYGKGLKDNEIDFGSFRDAKLLCETSTNFSDRLPAAQFMTTNIVLDTNETIFDNTKRLLQTCRGFLPFINGKYTLRIEKPEIPNDQFEITDDMIIGNINVQSADKNAFFNEARITYVNQNKDYKTDTLIYQDSTYRDADGEPLILSTAAPGIVDRERVKHHAKYLVDRSRQQLQVGLRLTTEGQDLVAGDLVRITHKFNTVLGGTDQTDYLFKAPTTTDTTTDYSAPERLFRIISTQLNYDGTVDLVLLEHVNDIFTVTPDQSEEDDDLDPGDGGGSTPICDAGEYYNYALSRCVPIPDDDPPPVSGRVRVSTSVIKTNALGRFYDVTFSITHDNYLNSWAQFYLTLNNRRVETPFKNLTRETTAITYGNVAGFEFAEGDILDWRIWFVNPNLTTGGIDINKPDESGTVIFGR
jgi:hypothetical protein